MKPWQRNLLIAATVVIVASVVLSGDTVDPGINFTWKEVDPTGKGQLDANAAENLRAVTAKAERLRAMASDYAGYDVAVRVTKHGGFDPPDTGFDDGYHRKSPTSPHHYGKALDLLTPSGFSDAEWHGLALQQHKQEGGGLGLYPGFVHIDVRQKTAAPWQEKGEA